MKNLGQHFGVLVLIAAIVAGIAIYTADTADKSASIPNPIQNAEKISPGAIYQVYDRETGEKRGKLRFYSHAVRSKDGDLVAFARSIGGSAKSITYLGMYGIGQHSLEPNLALKRVSCYDKKSLDLVDKYSSVIGTKYEYLDGALKVLSWPAVNTVNSRERISVMVLNSHNNEIEVRNAENFEGLVPSGSSSYYKQIDK